MKNKGITLVALIITIVVLLVLAMLVIGKLSDTNMIELAKDTVEKFYISSIKEKILLGYSETKIEDKDAKGEYFFELLSNNLDFDDGVYVIKEDSLLVNVDTKYSFKVYENGKIEETEVVVLDIADGCIDISSKGYVRGTMTPASSGYSIGTGELVEYEGVYIITGTSTTNAIRLTDIGTYDVALKDVNINLKGINISACAINCNKGNHKTDKFVNLYLSGNNTLVGSAAGIGFVGATPNVDGVTNGSTLTIRGPGSLYVEGAGFCAAIGSGYNGFDSSVGTATNIIINSGNLDIKPATNGAGIGGGLRKSANNIIINGGNINIKASNRASIGGVAGTLENLTINGGNLTLTGGEYGAAIGGGEGSGKITINGGNIYLSKKQFIADSVLGECCSEIEINGGTIYCYSNRTVGIGTVGQTDQIININGGSINVDVPTTKFSTKPTKAGEKKYI